MKLNQRVWLTIVPVIIVGYVFIFTGLYQYEKAFYLRQTKNQLELITTQLQARFEQHKSFTNNHIERIVESDAFTQLLGPAINLGAFLVERNLGNTLRPPKDIDEENLALTIMASPDNILYHYRQNSSPFEKADESVVHIGERALTTKNHRFNTLLLTQKKLQFATIKVINELSLKSPNAISEGKNIAIILTNQLDKFEALLTDLQKKEGYTISWQNRTSDFPPSTEPGPGLSASATLLDNINITLTYPQKKIDDHLLSIISQIVLIAVLLIFFSSLLLIYLIERHITGPIQKLEKSILTIDDQQTLLPEPLSANDEISSLSRTLYNLHNRLIESNRYTRELADTDGLTKLFNRRKYMDCLNRLIRRSNNKQSLVLLYIDIDNFKHVNDHFGHKVGDELLKDFSEKLRSTLRLGDMALPLEHDIARLAGDEFSVVLHHFNDETDAAKVAERILHLFQDGFHTEEGNFPVSASIGIALYPRDATTPEELINCADTAMYQAKKSGKNQYQFYSTELAEKLLREQRIEHALKAKEHSEFSIHYMPIVDSVSEQIVAVEALIRWNSKTLGQVSPTEFIPIVEKKGLFEQLDLWVINHVLEDADKIHEIFGCHCKLSINISSAVLSSGTFFYELMKIKNNHPALDATVIVLEITETFSTTLSKRVEANLELLKQAGFELALDDFGTGYTTLLQLLDYPVDIIKIDKSMTKRITNSDDDLVVSLVQFIKKQGFRVTAEGVETTEQLNLVRKAGVNTIQGFYFYQPAPLDVLAIEQKRKKS